MKYIRTKNGIYKNEDLIGVQYQGKIYYNDEEVIAQADTIKELCDLFIMKTPNSYFESKYLKDLLPHYNKICDKKDIKIFGVICVVGDNEEPIVKDVAKMNNKGDLELL